MHGISCALFGQKFSHLKINLYFGRKKVRDTQRNKKRKQQLYTNGASDTGPKIKVFKSTYIIYELQALRGVGVLKIGNELARQTDTHQADRLTAPRGNCPPANRAFAR